MKNPNRHDIFSLALILADIDYQDKAIEQLFSVFGKKSEHYIGKLVECQRKHEKLGGAFFFLTSYLTDKDFALFMDFYNAKTKRNYVSRSNEIG